MKIFEKELKKLSKERHKYEYSYNYWCRELFTRVVRLFEWQGLPFPQKELEQRLLALGYCGIIPYNNGYIVTNVSLSGITEYEDEFTDITYANPKISGTHKIDENYILCNNDSLRNSILPIISYYAHELAHADITMINSLVNKRIDSAMTASSGAEYESAMSFINNLYNGVVTPITSELFSSIKFNQFANNNNDTFIKCYELRHNLLNEFYECFGIASTYEKKANMTTDEVTRNNQLLLINIDDMLKSRIEIADKLSTVLQHEVTVRTIVNYNEGVIDNDN